MVLMKLMFSQSFFFFKNLLNQHLSITTFLLQVEVSRVSGQVLITKTNSMQQEQETLRIIISSTIYYIYHPLLHKILHGLPIKEIIASTV